MYLIVKVPIEYPIKAIHIKVSASSRIEQLTPINFEHFRSQTCSGDASYGSWLNSCEGPPFDAEYGLG